MNPVHAAVSTLPLAIHWLVPELTALEWPEEARADCGDCTMVRAGLFHPEGRCCTYQPLLANFLVGRILRDGGTGASLVRAEIDRGAVVTSSGVAPVRREQYHRREPGAFGTALDLRCPYFVGGELACGVWRHRNSVCRTWHCRYVHGQHGWYAWEGMRQAIDCAEAVLAHHCARTETPPREGAGLDSWLAWYRACADLVDRLEPATLQSLEDAGLAEAREKLRAWYAAVDVELPHVLGPTVRQMTRDEDQVTLVGYSRFDSHTLPSVIFELLSRLDGTRTWWTALAEAEEAAGRPIGGEPLVRTLWRLGVLAPPRPEDQVAPGSFAMILRDDLGNAWRRTEPASEVGTVFQAADPPE